MMCCKITWEFVKGTDSWPLPSSLPFLIGPSKPSFYSRSLGSCEAVVLSYTAIGALSSFPPGAPPAGSPVASVCDVLCFRRKTFKKSR